MVLAIVRINRAWWSYIQWSAALSCTISSTILVAYYTERMRRLAWFVTCRIWKVRFSGVIRDSAPRHRPLPSPRPASSHRLHRRRPRPGGRFLHPPKDPPSGSFSGKFFHGLATRLPLPPQPRRPAGHRQYTRRWHHLLSPEPVILNRVHCHPERSEGSLHKKAATSLEMTAFR